MRVLTVEAYMYSVDKPLFTDASKQFGWRWSDHMAARVLGVGVGVFCIAAVWITAIFLFFLFSKLKRPISYIGTVGVLLAALVTVILLCMPREKGDEEYQPHQEHQDTMFIWRTALLVLMGLSLLIGCVIMISEHWAVPITAKKLQNSQRGIVHLKST